MEAMIEDLILNQKIASGDFGDVYLSSKRGRSRLFATKIVDRKIADSPGVHKYFKGEISILSEINHPNIIRLEEVKKSQNHYYIVTEYCNGGTLAQYLELYKKKTGYGFPEDIVQHLTRQIVEAIKYLHDNGIIHRDLKLDNILVNFSNEIDKLSGNLLNAQVKIIGLLFATRLNEDGQAFTTIGSPNNMDPIILKKLSSGAGTRQLGYDEKADIWSLGTLCYEMCIGKPVFDAGSLNELVNKVEKGAYSVPSNLSKEFIYFLNAMLQYNNEKRLSARELVYHPFLTKKVSQFSHIDDITKLSQHLKHNKLNLNTRSDGVILNSSHGENERVLIHHQKNLCQPNNNARRVVPQQQYNQKINAYPNQGNNMIYSVVPTNPYNYQIAGNNINPGVQGVNNPLIYSQTQPGNDTECFIF